MTEPARKPCCITGCKRTFRADRCGDGEIMCGRHYRCDLRLVEHFKSLKARFRKIGGRLNKIHARGGASVEWLEQRWQRAWRPVGDAWAALKAEAQRQQDAGFFAPKPRRRKVLQSTFDAEPHPHSTRIASKFEDQFQRMKRAQVAARAP